ncbi:S4 domain protein YaaA [Anaeroplasma bactoclasticum]|uniref:S4 domain protein YaaA n=2 Tax=Anaeroplasma bactoclasticum TaxID=2088 RepID=A0A397QVA5_9MOLU|nr:S4 domain protein YaaA [Anaeroplasma bactoclasticum]
MKIINIKTEYIELQQLLKMEDYISSGGQAKYYLMENEVLVNGVIETRRGRKLRANDVIKIGKEEYQIAWFLKLN